MNDEVEADVPIIVDENEQRLEPWPLRDAAAELLFFNWAMSWLADKARQRY